MVGRTAPDFIGEVPGGGWVRLRSLEGKPTALVIFRPGAPYARELVIALGRLRKEPAFSETAFLGVSNDTEENTERFGASTGGVLPTLLDPGPVARDYEVRDAAIILIDPRRFVRYRLDGFAGPRFRERLEAAIEALRRLPSLDELPAREVHLQYTKDPLAPVFTARDVGGTTIDLAALRGQVVVIHFFDQECPRCERDLKPLVPVLKELRPKGARAIGIVSRDLGGGLPGFLKEHAIDYPVIVDSDRSLFTRFDVTQTPALFVLDRDGFIRFREQGDRPDRADLTRLQVLVALGRETPAALAAALPRGRYLGDGQCAVCHQREHRDWLSTPHSIAWDSLSQGETWKDPQCVPCHVTGAMRPGGYASADDTPHMTDVQCEACHGMGGGHPEGRPIDPQAIAALCATCHTGKFVLHVPLEKALTLMGHRDPPDPDRLFQYSDARRRRLEEINKRRLEWFKPGVAHVGAEACRDCHRKEYDQWSRTPHAAAYARLLRDDRAADPSCTPCHTTGSGLKNGFGDPNATASLTGVQCEVCHGPGGDHVSAPNALKRVTIYGLTGQCSFCLVQGVCSACHDQENDPDFAFEPALAQVKH